MLAARPARTHRAEYQFTARDPDFARDDVVPALLRYSRPLSVPWILSGVSTSRVSAPSGRAAVPTARRPASLFIPEPEPKAVRVKHVAITVPAAAVAALLGCGAPAERTGGAVDSLAATDAALRDELLRMGMLDQTARAGLTVRAGADTIYARATLAIDSVLTRRLRAIIAEHGWPEWSRVGRAAGQAAFLILQHSPSDAFQRRTLPLLEEAASNGEAAWSDVALLTDRLLTHDGKPQRYGTQFRIVNGALVPYPIEDIDSLEHRRARAGLTPMREYVRLLEAMYQGPVRWPPDSARPN